MQFIQQMTAEHVQNILNGKSKMNLKDLQKKRDCEKHNLLMVP